MPEADLNVNSPVVRFSGSARGVSDETVDRLGLAAIISFNVSAIVITLIIKLF